MKKLVLGIIIGIIIYAKAVYASNYLYQADEVSYEPTDTNWNVNNVDSAIKELYNKINDANSALLTLKNTNIAKAVGANGDTFSSVINKLAAIINQGNKSFTVSGTSSITIPSGYYNGTGTINVSGLVPTPTGTKTITSNGSNIDVSNLATVNVNVPNTNSATYSVTSNGTKDMGATNNYRYVSVNVPTSSLRYTGATLLGDSTGSYVYNDDYIYVIVAQGQGYTAAGTIISNGQVIYNDAPSSLTTVSISGSTITIGGQANWRRVYRITR